MADTIYPLKFQLRLEPEGESQASQQDCNNAKSQAMDTAESTNVAPKPPPAPKYWSHQLYRGPDDKEVQVLYSATKEQSEKIAQRFLNETLLGFDMEWEIWKKERLQHHISVIQLACEDKIAIFHIGVHVGSTPDELIAPSLKKIIESPMITKVGSNIMAADGSRLIKHFSLKPKGMFELGHLHWLVTLGPHSPAEVKCKPRAMAKQVEIHLCMPLEKGAERTSSWSRRLNERQQHYAAADAYAGFMLYHVMNYKRLSMDPVPPLPLNADLYLPFQKSPEMPVRLESTEEGKEYITAVDVWPPPAVETAEPGSGDGVEGDENQDPAKKQRKPRAKKQKLDDGTSGPARRAKKEKFTPGPLTADDKALLSRLFKRRDDLATDAGYGRSNYIVAHNTTLEGIACRRPRNETELLEVKGMGPKKVEQYGAAWLEVVAKFQAERGITVEETTVTEVSVEGNIEPMPLAVTVAPMVHMGQATLAHESSASVESTGGCVRSFFQSPSTPSKQSRRRPAPSTPSGTGPPSSSPAFATPQLKTGLSFQFAETHLDTTDKKPSDTTANTPIFTTAKAELKTQQPPLRSLEDNVQDTVSLEDIMADIHSSDFSSSPNLSAASTPQQFYTPSDNQQPLSRPETPCPVSISPLTRSPLSQKTHPELSRAEKKFQGALNGVVQRVAHKLGKDKEQIVSASTIRVIVMSPPKSENQLHKIPGVRTFLDACRQADVDLMKFVSKYGGGR